MAAARSQKEALQHLTVYGYIREEYENLPDDLKDICFQFYLRVFDRWNIDKCNTKLDIDVETGIIEAKYDDEMGFMNAFGSIIVKKGNIESWKIKLLIEGTYGAPTVGIVESYKASKDMQGPFNSDENRAGIAYEGYPPGKIYKGLNGNGGRRINDKWVYPQEITLTLNMTVNEDVDRKYGRLSMKKGGSQEMTIHDKIDLDKEYCLALCVFLSFFESHHKLQMVQD